MGKTGLKAARLAFLYGEGDGKPVVNVQRLCEISGCREQAVRRHVHTWLREKEDLVSKGSQTSLALHLSAETLQLHKSDVSALRLELDSCKNEMRNLTPIIETIGGLIEHLTEDDRENALALFDRYLRASLNKTNVTKRFLALQSQWTKLSGVDSLMTIQETGAKALTLARAKLESKAGADELDPSTADVVFKFKRRE